MGLVVACQWLPRLLAVGLVEVGSQLFVLPSQPPPPGVTPGSPGWISNWWFPYILAGLGLLSAAPLLLLLFSDHLADTGSGGNHGGEGGVAADGGSALSFQSEAAETVVPIEVTNPLDRYLADSATMLGRLFGNPLFCLYVADILLLDAGLYGMQTNTVVMVEEVYRSPVSPQVVGLLVLSTAVVVAALAGALVARIQPSPRLLALLNILLLGNNTSHNTTGFYPIAMFDWLLLQCSVWLWQSSSCFYLATKCDLSTSIR